MSDKIILEVTQEDIDAVNEHRDRHIKRIAEVGITKAFEHEDAYNAPVHCPVSRAATRLFGSPHSSAAGFINNAGYTLQYSAVEDGDPIYKFQAKFDSLLPVQPFSVELKCTNAPYNGGINTVKD